MSLRVVSVQGPAWVQLRDTHVSVCRDGEELGRVPIEDMAVLVLDGPDLVLSHQVLSFCADHGVAVLTADAKHMPNGLLLPLANHSTHSATLRAQIEATIPNQKRTWQSIVRSKIAAQGDLVEALGGDPKPLRRLAPLVRSGDPDNVEATAAARYFSLVFGADFIRDREKPGMNACLNYGYAVVRSAVARAVVGAGMHPAIGVHHRNKYNAFCLADDAMEPLRTLVDYRVWLLVERGKVPDDLDSETKRHLVGVLGEFVRIGDLRYPLFVGLERYAASLRRSICDGADLAPAIPVFEPILDFAVPAEEGTG